MNNKKKMILWPVFDKRNNVTIKQIEQFQLYAQLLQQWNKKMNLTAITDIEGIVEHHFQDSIEIAKFVDFKKYHTVADVGAGAGFPGIALKILFPHVQLILIEVNNKKIRFMQEVVGQLGLDDVHFVSDDWRTFLRASDIPIDLFLARASLQPVELLRIYKPSSIYKNAELIYWASQHWRPSDATKAYIKDEKTYVVGDKKRRYIFFANKISN
ncbi:MAG: 16S rRNA (guanine(527)-N(7))-methyltransferase RsmG [Candidatus Dependentiae bacterium]